MKKPTAALLSILTTLLFGLPLQGEDIKAFWNDQILVSRDIVNERQRNFDKAIPQYILDRAKAVVVIEQFKAGFILGASHGYAVATVKTSTGMWSSPAMYKLKGGSIGLQIGGERRDIILVILNEEGLDILDGTGGSDFGVEVTAAAGPTQSMGEGKLEIKSHTLAYTSGEGLSLGVSLSLGRLGEDKEANQTYYSTRGLRADDILFKNKVRQTNAAIQLAKALDQNKLLP